MYSVISKFVHHFFYVSVVLVYSLVTTLSKALCLGTSVKIKVLSSGKKSLIFYFLFYLPVLL